MSEWTVELGSAAKKQYKKLKRSGSKKPSIADMTDYLVLDLQKLGPYVAEWPHYSPLGKETFHCHLRRGHPTYVACWKIVDKEHKQIEVYYVGTHQNAPY